MFTGKPVSQTTGLYFDYQRWYDSSTGRFISQDPLAGDLSDPQSLNSYVYAQNSPTTYADPTGMAIAPPLHGGSCPAIWQDPIKSLECSFGIGASGTVTGGGQGAGGGTIGPPTGAIDPDPGAAIVVGILWGVWGGYEIYSHWDQWFGDNTGGGTISRGGTGGDGGTKTPGITGVTGITTILPTAGALTPGVGTPSIDMGRGPGPRQPPRTPGEDPSYLREKFTQKEAPGGSSRPWAAICSTLRIGGVILGGIVRAETSDSRIDYPLEGGGAGLVLCALAYARWG